ncbi:MAG TPA: protein kinase [Kofleriaceae bacterium]|nr:protein kinase [Kofleriaceae bacterium]
MGDSLDSSDIRHGSKVGRFVVEGQLGSGGMGVVYAAHDRELDRRIALKVLRGAVDEEQRKRLMREGQAMAKVTHENVITVHEVGLQGSLVFLAQELLDGGSLREWLESKHTQREILGKFIAAGRGLAAAHAVGLVHRDFKPDNVLLGKDGRVRVSDFGLARSLQSIETVPYDPQVDPLGATSAELMKSPMMTMTRTGAVMGTPLYMSPEQHAGEPADERSDQFSFCVALYEALYGGVPFPGKTSVALADAVMSGRMQPPPKSATVPARLRKILLRGLSTKPEERYPSMDALLADLTHDPSRKVRRFTMIAALVLLAVAGVVGGYALRSKTAAVGEVPARRTVAVLGFKNLAGDKSVEWISQGVSQLLAAQLATDDVRVTPADEASRARTDLALPNTDEFSKETLEKIRTRLGADAVVSGSYLLNGGEVTLVAVVQDIPRNKTSRIEVKGTTTELPALAEKAGTEIRQALGISSVAIAKKAYAVLPHDPTAVREYVEGTQALLAFDYIGAKRHLVAAVKAEADFAPSHVALAQAYAGLFDADASHASAKEALATAKTLPIDQQMLVAREAYVLLGQVEEAREQARRLFALHPDNVDDGIALAQLQTPEDAVSTLATLRKLPPPAGDDPRLDVVEGRAELDRQAAPRALELARHAATVAQTRNATATFAEARQLEGEALVAAGELGTAQQAFEDARKRFESARDQLHMLESMESLADLALERGQIDAAFQSYDTLGALRQQGGQRGPASRAIASAAYALALKGDLAGAEKRIRQAEKLSDQDPIGVPTIDLASGVLAWAKLDSEVALDRLDKCNARFASVLPASSALCQQLRGEIQADLGDAEAARKSFQDAQAIADKVGNAARSGEAQLGLAQLDLDEEGPDDKDAKIADKVVEQATAIQTAAAAHGAAGLEARAWITLARARLAQAESQKALEAIEKVGKQQLLRVEVDRAVTEALTYNMMNDAFTARERLDAVKAIADKQGCVSLQLEARLALAQVLPPEEGKAELDAVLRDAKARNLGRIVKRAQILAQP